MKEHKLTPEEAMSAALELLAAGGDYRPAYDMLLELYGASSLREDAFTVMTEAFYAPNERELKKRYQKNCRLLERYPYLFRQDFPDFGTLPLRFFPYDDDSYIPFDGAAFLSRVIPGDRVITRNFFSDLEKPILANDVFSQYELEYLCDNVRKSEDIARDNHIYLHYSNWNIFCAWLQVLDMKPLLHCQKLVFLIEDERELYPIDFKKRFGIDYSVLTPKPIGVRDVHRAIWCTQLSTHNGVDFFNEIFDEHPNLLLRSSVLLEDMEQYISLIRDGFQRAGSLEQAQQVFRVWNNPSLVAELYSLRPLTDKDLVVAFHLSQKDWITALDQDSRIAPAVFLQPHFLSMGYTLRPTQGYDVYMESAQAENIRKSPVFRGFKYIKTFTPMRRFTTSYGASIRYMNRAGRRLSIEDGSAAAFIENSIVNRVMNRSYMADPTDPLFHDSVIVRFEDAKLNPKAVFTALAAFLDLPFSNSMTYCSETGTRNPHSDIGDEFYAAGFSLTSVYATHDAYTDDAERAFIEYCFRDAYEYYGYDFHYYHGQQIDELIENFHTLDDYIRCDWEALNRTVEIVRDGVTLSIGPDSPLEERRELLDRQLADYREMRQMIGRLMGLPLRYVNHDGIPLQYQPLLKLDATLLKCELYH